MNAFIQRNIKRPVEAAPLAVFRVLFGLMMLLSIIRFWSYGWIEKLYLQPEMSFSYFGFEWVKPIGGYTYLIFILCALSAICVAVGFKYRISIILFFLSFTYIELMDKTTYLNHYYFISLLSFLMIFLPANAYYSLDARLDTARAFQKIPAWTINSIKLMLGIVYFYAGIAKINSDWLLDAMPLKIWLPAKFDIPIIGAFVHEEWLAYAFSWGGMLYDISIPFLLLYKRTRIYAFILVLIFHILTRVLFPIGMFPYIMIVSSLIFFDAGLHHKILRAIDKLVKLGKSQFDNGLSMPLWTGSRKRILSNVLIIFFVLQLAIPFRYLLYPGELFWTEEGYRFSWRVMLMEKSGYAQFKVVNGNNGKWFYVDNSEYLTPFQEKQMSFQPDFILEYAHFLKNHYTSLGEEDVEVYVDCHVSLNGRRSKRYIDPEVNLAAVKESFKHKTWILPFEDEFKGI